MDIPTAVERTREPIDIMVDFSNQILENLDSNLTTLQLDCLCRIMDNLFHRRNLGIRAEHCYMTMLYILRDTESAWLIGILNDVLDRRQEPIPFSLLRPAVRIAQSQHQSKVLELFLWLWCTVARIRRQNAAAVAVPNNGLQLIGRIVRGFIRLVSPWSSIQWVPRILSRIFEFQLNAHQPLVDVDDNEIGPNDVVVHHDEGQEIEVNGEVYDNENTYYQSGREIRNNAESYRFLPFRSEFFDDEEFEAVDGDVGVTGQPGYSDQNAGLDQSATFSDGTAVGDVSLLMDDTVQFANRPSRGEVNRVMVDLIDGLDFEET